MFIEELAKKFNFHIIKKSVDSLDFTSFNYYTSSVPKNKSTLYFSTADYIDDPNCFFLFLNRTPAGTHPYYYTIQTELTEQEFFSYIQQEFIIEKTKTNMLSDLTKIVTNTSSIDSIIDTASKIINNPIVVSSASYDLITANTNDSSHKNPLLESMISSGKISPDIVEIIESIGFTKDVILNNDTVVLDNPRISNCPIVSGKIMHRKKLIGYIGIFLTASYNIIQAQKYLSQLIIILENNYAELAVFFNDRYFKDKQYLYHLLTSHVPMPADILFRPSKYFRLIYVSYDGGQIIYNHTYYLNELMNENIIGTIYDKKLILLVTYSNSFDKVLQHITRTAKNPKFTYLISPEFCGLEEVCKMYPLLNGQYPYTKNIIHIDRTIQSLYNPSTSLYNRTFEIINKLPNQNALLETLCCYIECNTNISECSEKLYLHRNSVIKRLNKIAEIGAIDLHDYIELTNFYIYYILKTTS